MSKENKAYLLEAKRIATALHEARLLAPEFTGAWFDNGFNSSLTNTAISDEGYEFTQSELTALITLVQQFQNFMGNSAVTTGDYGNTLNNIRLA